MEIENINLREEYYNQIHSMKPMWWMRWGIVSVGFLLAIILILGYVIQYPDVIYTEARLTTNQPSVTLPIANESQIEEVMINNGDFVEKETILAIIKNNGNYKDILQLEEALQALRFERQDILSFFETYATSDLHLGSLVEKHWILFSDQLLGYYKIEQLESFDHQKIYLQKEINRQSQLQKKYRQLISKDQKEQQLINARLKADSILYQKGVLSEMQYNESKRSYYGKSKELQQNGLSLQRVNLEITRLQNAIQNFGQNESENVLTYELGIRKSLYQLKSAISEWEQKYLITSPIDGTVNFMQPLVAGQFYDGNIIVITPVDKEYYAQLKIPFAGAGKAEKGQKVIIKLNDYPYREYGLLSGQLDKMALVAGEDHYRATVLLDVNSLSSFGKELMLKENMSGVGEVITQDHSVLGRVFEKILYAFHQNKT